MANIQPLNLKHYAEELLDKLEDDDPIGDAEDVRDVIREFAEAVLKEAGLDPSDEVEFAEAVDQLCGRVRHVPAHFELTKDS